MEYFSTVQANATLQTNVVPINYETVCLAAFVRMCKDCRLIFKLLNDGDLLHQSEIYAKVKYMKTLKAKFTLHKFLVQAKKWEERKVIVNISDYDVGRLVFEIESFSSVANSDNFWMVEGIRVSDEKGGTNLL